LAAGRDIILSPGASTTPASIDRPEVRSLPARRSPIKTGGLGSADGHLSPPGPTVGQAPAWRPHQDSPTLPHHARLLSPRLLSAITAGPPGRDRFGLTVIPIQVRGADAARPQLAQPLDIRELQPPVPGKVVAAGATGPARTAAFGQRLTGGMADRVVVATSPMRRGENALIPVAPLEPRWWDEGPLRLRGQLSPALLALLHLAMSDWIGLRSLARTALWEACREPSLDDPAAEEGGWALLDGPTLLAAHLMLPPAASSPPVPGPPPDPRPSALVRRALSDAAWDDRVGWAVHSQGHLIKLSIVRASFTLPDAVLRAAALD